MLKYRDFTAIFCLFHCTALNWILLFFIDKFESSSIHRYFLYFTVPILIYSHLSSISRKRVLSLILFILGACILGIQVLFPELFKIVIGMCNCCYGKYFTFIGSALL